MFKITVTGVNGEKRTFDKLQVGAWDGIEYHDRYYAFGQYGLSVVIDETEYMYPYHTVVSIKTENV